MAHPRYRPFSVLYAAHDAGSLCLRLGVVTASSPAEARALALCIWPSLDALGLREHGEKARWRVRTCGMSSRWHPSLPVVLVTDAEAAPLFALHFSVRCHWPKAKPLLDALRLLSAEREAATRTPAPACPRA